MFKVSRCLAATRPSNAVIFANAQGSTRLYSSDPPAPPPERDLIKTIWKHFTNSLIPRRFWGDLKGEDEHGNKYFEIPPDRRVGRSKSSRYFEPKVKDRFDNYMPAEWESWLRMRRTDPPTKEEIARNREILELTRKNAAEKGYVPKTFVQEKTNTFPRYEEYEVMPGEKQDWKKGGDV